MSAFQHKTSPPGRGGNAVTVVSKATNSTTSLSAKSRPFYPPGLPIPAQNPSAQVPAPACQKPSDSLRMSDNLHCGVGEGRRSSQTAHAGYAPRHQVRQFGILLGPRTAETKSGHIDRRRSATYHENRRTRECRPRLPFRPCNSNNYCIYRSACIDPIQFSNQFGHSNRQDSGILELVQAHMNSEDSSIIRNTVRRYDQGNVRQHSSPEIFTCTDPAGRTRSMTLSRIAQVEGESEEDCRRNVQSDSRRSRHHTYADPRGAQQQNMAPQVSYQLQPESITTCSDVDDESAESDVESEELELETVIVSSGRSRTVSSSLTICGPGSIGTQSRARAFTGITPAPKSSFQARILHFDQPEQYQSAQDRNTPATIDLGGTQAPNISSAQNPQMAEPARPAPSKTTKSMLCDTCNVDTATSALTLMQPCEVSRIVWPVMMLSS